jgi:hypothetical protein
MIWQPRKDLFAIVRSAQVPFSYDVINLQEQLNSTWKFLHSCVIQCAPTVNPIEGDSHILMIHSVIMQI